MPTRPKAAACQRLRHRTLDAGVAVDHLASGRPGAQPGATQPPEEQPARQQRQQGRQHKIRGAWLGRRAADHDLHLPRLTTSSRWLSTSIFSVTRPPLGAASAWSPPPPGARTVSQMNRRGETPVQPRKARIVSSMKPRRTASPLATLSTSRPWAARWPNMWPLAYSASVWIKLKSPERPAKLTMSASVIVRPTLSAASPI